MRHYAWLIVWADSSSDSGGWQRMKGVRTEEYDITTIGFMIAKNDKVVTVTTSIALQNGDVMDPFTIPRRCIKSMRRLPQYVEG